MSTSSNAGAKNTYRAMRPQGLYEEVLSLRASDGEAFYKKYCEHFVTVTCPACDSKDLNHVFERYHFHHDRCHKCRTFFTNPRPRDEQLKSFYTDFESAKKWTALLVQADVQRKALQYQPRAEMIINLVRQQSIKGPLRAADLGAGSGAFASALKNSGYFEEVYALDFSSECVEACKKQGLTAMLGSVETLQDESFSLLTMNDLIEHLFDPYQFLQECHSKLKPGGLIAIACPNGEGFDFQILKNETGNITPPEHLNYFHPESLSLLLKRAGFDTVLVETPGKLDVAIIGEARANGLNLAGQNQFLENIYATGNAELLEDLQALIAKHKLSSHMLAIGRK